MRKNFALLCLTVWVCVGNAQIIIVKDREALKPIAMASISGHEIAKYETTDAGGRVDISSFVGAEKIEIRCIGYSTVTTSYEELEQLGFVVMMESSRSHFDEIVVSATRWGQSLRSTPSKISVILPKDVALYNPQTAADLLGSSGEVFIQKSQQGGGSPMIRGFATHRLLYAVDGVRMNNAIFRAGNIQQVISLDPFAIENTEVFFGPGSVIYGSDAIGGVMSFQTMTPRLLRDERPMISGNAASRFSSANNEFTNHFDINLGGKKWASVTGFTYSNFGDLKMGRHGPDEYLKTFYVQRVDEADKVFENTSPKVQIPTGYQQMNLMQKFRFKPSDNWDFQYGFHYSETSEYSRYDRLIEKTSNGLPRAAVWNYGPQIWMMKNLLMSYKANQKVFDQMTIRLAKQYFEESRIDRRFNHHRLKTQLEEVDAYSFNADFEKSANKHRVLYGLEYVYNDVKSKGSAIDIRNGNPIAVPDRYPASTWRSYAAYLNYQYSASDHLMMQLGARFNAFDIQSDFSRHLEFYPFDFTDSSIKNNAITGSLGFVYSPDGSLKVSVNAGTGFRAPNVDDIGKIFDFASGEVVVPNAALSAEYAYSGELNVAKIFGDVLKLDISAFYTYLDNAMVRRPFQVNGRDSIIYNGELSKVFAIQNASFGNVYGFNAGLELTLAAGISLTSRYNYQIGKEELEDGELSPSRHAAPAFGTTRLTFRQDKLTMQIYADYSAGVSFENLNFEQRGKPVIYAKDTAGNPFSPSWYTINVKAMYQFHEHFTISTGVENLADQRYRPYSSGLTAPGRNFIISLKAGF